jgi:hypothetical protein
MKPVLVQNLIQAAKKKRGKLAYSDIASATDKSDGRSKSKDRSSSIILAALLLFLVIVVLTTSIS